jgi:hypothetical protein
MEIYSALLANTRESSCCGVKKVVMDIRLGESLNAKTYNFKPLSGM